MTNEEYLPFEMAFLAAARPRLEQLREHLLLMGHPELGELVQVDHDVSRGLGFGHHGNDQLFIELMLEDGDTHGFEGVSLVLNCSAWASGQVWAPLNFTGEVGMTEPSAIEERFLQFFDAETIVASVAGEWSRIEGEMNREHPN